MTAMRSLIEFCVAFVQLQLRTLYGQEASSNSHHQWHPIPSTSMAAATWHIITQPLNMMKTAKAIEKS